MSEERLLKWIDDLEEKEEKAEAWICGACYATNVYADIHCHMCHRRKRDVLGRRCEHCGMTMPGRYEASISRWNWLCPDCGSTHTSRDAFHLMRQPDWPDTKCHRCGSELVERQSSLGGFCPTCGDLPEDYTYFRKGTDGKVKEIRGPCRLHLGCGTRRLPGYTHVDSRPEVDPDVVADIENLEKFESGVADLIYAAHVLEHIPRPHILTVLEEWRRVLKPGGTLRLSVPDFNVLAELYLYEGVSMWRITGPLHGRQDYEANTHFMSFDYEYMAWMLGTAGYHDIRRWYPAEVHPAGYDDISLAKIDNRYISLNVEATAG